MVNKNKDAAKIIRDAEKILKESSKKPTKVNVKVSSETIKLAKTFNKYKELSGKKRLSTDEKHALLKYTPKQVLKSKKLTQKAYEKRIVAFKELTGHDPTPSDYADLRYLTASQAYKKSKPNPELTEEESGALYPDTFSEVDFHTVRWWDIPSIIRSSAEERRPGGLLYENTEIFWNNPEKISLARLFFEGSDGRQFSVVMALRTILMANGYSDILISPKDVDRRFAVYREEWENVEELAPDYIETRKYRKKS